MLTPNGHQPLVPLLLPGDVRGPRILIVAGSSSLINLLEDSEPDRKAAGNPSGRDLAQLFGGSLTASPQSTDSWFLDFRAIIALRCHTSPPPAVPTPPHPCAPPQRWKELCPTSDPLLMLLLLRDLSQEAAASKPQFLMCKIRVCGK